MRTQVATFLVWTFLTSTAWAQEVPYLTDDYVVTGTRTERDPEKAPIATEVISKEELEITPATKLSEVLQQSPGVTIDRELKGAGAGVQLQGMDSKHVLILVDGQPVVGRFGGVVDMDRFLLAGVDRIEIIKGPSSALYGSDAMGGVVNIITDETTGPRVSGEVGASYGSLNEVDSFGKLSFQAGKWNVKNSVGFHRRDAFDLDESDPSTTGGEDQMLSLVNRTSYALKTNVDLLANLRFNTRHRSDVDFSRGAVFNRDNQTHEGSVSLGPKVKFSNGSSLQVTGHYALFDNTLTISNPESSSTTEETLQQYAQVSSVYTMPLWDNHDVTFVGDGILESYEADRLNRSSAERMRAAAAIQDEWRIVDTLQLVSGVRVDFDTQFGVHPTPKVAARFDAMDELTFRASYAMGFRAPDFKELYLEFDTPNSPIVVRGNAELEAETSHGFNAGFEVKVASLIWNVNGFRNEIDNLILVRPVLTGLPETPTDFEYQNVSRARTQGLETSISAKIHPTLRVGLGYMFTDAKDLEEERELEGRATHRGNTSVSWLPSFGFEGTLALALTGPRVYFEEQSGTEDLEIQTDPYAILDIRLAQRLPWDLKVFGGVRNALDAGDPTYLSLAPRTFYAGLSVGFESAH